MSATRAAQEYARIDRLAQQRLLKKQRQAARRVNWRNYAVHAKGYRKKFFATLAKAVVYWNAIKAEGSVPVIQSWRFKSAVVSSTTVAIPLKVKRPFPVAVTPSIRTHAVRISKWHPANLIPFAMQHRIPTAIVAALGVIALFA